MFGIHHILLISGAVAIKTNEILFTAFGDYGHESKTFDAVVNRLNSQAKARFATLLGDLAYPKGFQSIDDPKWNQFRAFSNSAHEFYAVLGNHDWKSSKSVPVILEFAKKNKKFIFPNTYHSKQMDIDGGYKLCMLFLDTHNLEKDQLRWIRTELSKCGSEKVFRLLFGHYLVHSVGKYAADVTTVNTRKKLEPIMNEFGVHAYIAGHEHQMQAFVDKGRHYLISGSVGDIGGVDRFDDSVSGHILKFRRTGIPGFVNFYQNGGSLVYRFIDAYTGDSLYESRIEATTTTTDAISEEQLIGRGSPQASPQDDPDMWLDAEVAQKVREDEPNLDISKKSRKKAFSDSNKSAESPMSFASGLIAFLIMAHVHTTI
jgi:predicted phosphodiesterase